MAQHGSHERSNVHSKIVTHEGENTIAKKTSHYHSTMTLVESEDGEIKDKEEGFAEGQVSVCFTDC
jgi:hypothetical protein